MSQSIYESVTSTIIEALKKGVVPWRKPWNSTLSLPINAVSQRPYRGVNPFLLSIAPFKDYRWLTFNQLKDRGGSVRKGERSSMVVFWKHWQPPPDLSDEELEAEKQRHRIPLLRYFQVFNLEQTEEHGFPNLYVPPDPTEEMRYAAARELVRSMPSRPRIQEGASAWYRPGSDLVQIPRPGDFSTGDDYFATLFHELAHATGHPSRLNRHGITEQIQFGSGEYSREELVAELASAFCCATVSLDNSLLDGAAAYIEGWLDVLKADPKALVIAAAQAQKAADFIRGVTYL